MFFFVRFFEESVTLVKALDTVDASEILHHKKKSSSHYLQLQVFFTSKRWLFWHF